MYFCMHLATCVVCSSYILIGTFFACVNDKSTVKNGFHIRNTCMHCCTRMREYIYVWVIFKPHKREEFGYYVEELLRKVIQVRQKYIVRGNECCDEFMLSKKINIPI